MNYFIKFGKNRLNIKKTLMIGIFKRNGIDHHLKQDTSKANKSASSA
jgi:hypothetical protein